jgi:UDP-2-acetamido-2,6-beta-L-arabino-hexul-4-ose reductase
MSGNYGFTSELLRLLREYNNKCPILITSSVQAELDNAYGISKKAGEEAIFSHAEQTGAKALVYRLPNLFGKWCRPNYNSVIATFCHNIAHDMPITINDRSTVLNLVYIDDLVKEFKAALYGKEHRDGKFCYVPVTYRESLGAIADMLYKFKEGRKALQLPDVSGGFEKALYSTFLSYLPDDAFSYPLKMNVDHRGSFTEIIRTPERGQFSVNISNEGIEKGNHWHNTKCEKFVVVKGNAQINFRRIGTDKICSYNVNGDKIEVVDIPPGYTHNIINTGKGELVTFMWANESFDPDNPDTFFEEVGK